LAEVVARGVVPSTMKACACLRKCWRTSVLAVTHVVEEHLDLFRPSSSSNHSATSRSNDGHDSKGCRPSEPDTEPTQTRHYLDGAWRVVDTPDSKRNLHHKFFAFIIERNTIAFADNHSCCVHVGPQPSAILFGDAMLEVVADRIAWLRFTQSSGWIRYEKVNLPTPLFLSSIQGSWECRKKKFEASSKTLTIKGAFWNLTEGLKSSSGIVRASDINDVAILNNQMIHTTTSGKLIMTCAAGRVRTFKRAAPHTQLWALEERTNT